MERINKRGRPLGSKDKYKRKYQRKQRKPLVRNEYINEHIALLNRLVPTATDSFDELLYHHSKKVCPPQESAEGQTIYLPVPPAVLHKIQEEKIKEQEEKLSMLPDEPISYSHIDIPLGIVTTSEPCELLKPLYPSDSNTLDIFTGVTTNITNKKIMTSDTLRVFTHLYGLYVLTCNRVPPNNLNLPINDDFISIAIKENSVVLKLDINYDKLCHAKIMYGIIDRVFVKHSIWRWWSTSDKKESLILGKIKNSIINEQYASRTFELHPIIIEFLKTKQNKIFELNKLLEYVIGYNQRYTIFEYIETMGCVHFRNNQKFGRLIDKAINYITFY